LVLDATTLLSDMGESTPLPPQSIRIRGIDAGARLVQFRRRASLKMLEAAQASSEGAGRAELTTARLALHWGPLIALPSGRVKGPSTAMSGHELLVAADLPGRHSLGALPARRCWMSMHSSSRAHSRYFEAKQRINKRRSVA